MAEAGDTEPLTQADKDHMRMFLKQIYARNPSMVDQWQMSDGVFEIVSEMVVEVVDCSDAMDFVPRPRDLIGGRGGARYVKKVLEGIAKRAEKNQMKPNRGIYISCRNFLAANYISELRMAGGGL